MVDPHQRIARGGMQHINILEPDMMYLVRPQFHPYLHGSGKIIPQDTTAEGYIFHIPGIQPFYHQGVIPDPGKHMLYQHIAGATDIHTVRIAPAAYDLHIVHQHVFTPQHPQAPVIAVQDGNILDTQVPAVHGVDAPLVGVPHLIGILLHADDAITAEFHPVTVIQVDLAVNVGSLLQIDGGIAFLDGDDTLILDAWAKVEQLSLLG